VERVLSIRKKGKKKTNDVEPYALSIKRYENLFFLKKEMK